MCLIVIVIVMTPSLMCFVANPVVTPQGIDHFLQESEQRHGGPAKLVRVCPVTLHQKIYPDKQLILG